jgi:hypothetical protein
MRDGRVENLFQSVVALQDRLRQAGIPSAVIGGVDDSTLAATYRRVRARRSGPHWQVGRT